MRGRQREFREAVAGAAEAAGLVVRYECLDCGAWWRGPRGPASCPNDPGILHSAFPEGHPGGRPTRMATHHHIRGTAP